MSRIIRLAALPALIAIFAVLPATGATAATSCKKQILGKERRLGTTYVTKVNVTGVSCTTGFGVVKAFHKCRHENGKAGTCKHKVLGYTCTEKRPASLKGPISYDGDMTCKRGAKRVTSHYQQNT